MQTDQGIENFGVREVLIFSVGYFRERKENIIAKKTLESVLRLKRQTLNRRLNGLKKEGVLTPEKHGICGYLLSKGGKDEYGRLYDRIMDLTFYPDLHKCEGRVGDVLSSIKDPENVIRVILCAANHVELDVVGAYMKEQSMRPDSKERTLLKELADTEGTLKMPFEAMLEQYSIIGKGPDDLAVPKSMGSILESTITAEVLRRRLLFSEAYAIYSDIVQRRSGHTSAYRIFSLAGMIYCTKSLKDSDTALKMTEEFLTTVDQPEYRIILMKCQADINVYQDIEKAVQIYHSCLKSLNTLKLYSLQCGIYNNLGVVHFRKNDHETSDHFWREAMSIANERKYTWIAAVIKLNIADFLALKGKIDRAKRLLGEARKFFLSVDDREGLSGYHFNRALVAIEEGDRDKAIQQFFKCEEFPLMYKEHIKDRRDVMNERFGSKGWEIPFP